MQTTQYGVTVYAQRITDGIFTSIRSVPDFSVCGGNAFSWSIRFCATRPAGDASLIQQEGIFMLGTKEGKLFYSAAGLGELNSGDGYTLQENVWYTVLVTYGQSELSLYIDGVRVASKTVSAASKVGNADYQIGRLFNGFVSYVRLYNFQLSPEQAKNEYKSDPLEQSKLELALEFTSDIAKERGKNHLYFENKTIDSSQTALVVHDNAIFATPSPFSLSSFGIELQVRTARPALGNTSTIFWNGLDGDDLIEIHLHYSPENDQVYFTGCLGKNLFEQKENPTYVAIGDTATIMFQCVNENTMQSSTLMVNGSTISACSKVPSPTRPMQLHLGNNHTQTASYTGGILSCSVYKFANGVLTSLYREYTFTSGEAIETLNAEYLQLPPHTELEPRLLTIADFNPEPVFSVSLRKLRFCHRFEDPQEDASLGSIPLHAAESLEWTAGNSFENPSCAVYIADRMPSSPYIAAELSCVSTDGAERTVTLSGVSNQGCRILGNIEASFTVSKNGTQTQKCPLENHSLAGAAGGAYLNPIDWSVSVSEETQSLGTTYHDIYILPSTPAAPWSITEASGYPHIGCVRLLSEAMRFYAFDFRKLPQPQSVKTIGTYLVYWLQRSGLFQHDETDPKYAIRKDGIFSFHWDTFLSAVKNGNTQKVKISSYDAAVLITLLTRLAGFQMNVLKIAYGAGNAVHYAATSATSSENAVKDLRVYDGVLKDKDNRFSANLQFSENDDKVVGSPSTSYYREMLFTPGQRCTAEKISY